MTRGETADAEFGVVHGDVVHGEYGARPRPVGGGTPRSAVVSVAVTWRGGRASALSWQLARAAPARARARALTHGHAARSSSTA